MRCWIFLLAVLPGCGIIPHPKLDHSIGVSYGNPRHGAGGYTQWDASGHTTIELIEYGNPDAEAVILAHELWHAATHNSDHPNGPDCISNADFDFYLTEPCPDELAQIPNTTFTVDFPENPLVAVKACKFWNEALGRECFIPTIDVEEPTVHPN